MSAQLVASTLDSLFVALTGAPAPMLTSRVNTDWPPDTMLMLTALAPTLTSATTLPASAP